MSSIRDFLPRDVVDAAEYVQNWFPETAVFLGGFATALYVNSTELWQSLRQTTHDVDVFISRSDLADLSDIEIVVPNRRLSKCQFIKNGIEIGVYVQGVASLAVPYEAISCLAEEIEGFRVACLEHLLVLKSIAWEDRRLSAKGEKDARDIVGILLCMSEKGLRNELLAGLSKTFTNHIEHVCSHHALLRIMNGNSHKASLALKKLESVNLAIREWTNDHDLPSNKI